MSAISARPFTVIGGFLGAGKTTLVNRILSAANGTRYAVLVNDFGQINVDADLIASHDGQTMALTNGCICCAMADSFVQTMLTLMQAPEAFDHVIVEASGVAQPGKIMDFARLDPLLDPDAVVTLIDTETLTDRLADPLIAESVAGQIRSADILVLTKGDLAGPDAIRRAQAETIALNPSAPRVVAPATQIDIAPLIGSMRAPDAAPAAPDGHAHFHSCVLTADSLPPAVFHAWDQALAPDILRGKGFVRLDDGSTHLWQRVGRRSTLTPMTGINATRLLLIATRPLAPDWPPG